MANRERFRGVFGPAHEWPPADLTLKRNRIDVFWHRKELQRQDALTFEVLDPGETVAFGCVYIQPTSVSAYDAAVYSLIPNPPRGGRRRRYRTPRPEMGSGSVAVRIGHIPGSGYPVAGVGTG